MLLLVATSGLQLMCVQFYDSPYSMYQGIPFHFHLYHVFFFRFCLEFAIILKTNLGILAMKHLVSLLVFTTLIVLVASGW